MLKDRNSLQVAPSCVTMTNMIARILTAFIIIKGVHSFCFLTSQRLAKQAVTLKEQQQSQLFWKLVQPDYQKLDDHSSIPTTNGFRKSIRSIFTRERKHHIPKIKSIIAQCPLCIQTTSTLDNNDDDIHSSSISCFDNQQVDNEHHVAGQRSNIVSQASTTSYRKIVSLDGIQEDDNSETAARRKSNKELLHRIRSGKLTDKEKESFFMSALKSGSTVHTRRPAIITDPGHTEESIVQNTQRNTTANISFDRTKISHLPRLSKKSLEDLTTTSSQTQMKTHMQTQKSSSQFPLRSQSANIDLGRRLGAAAFAEQLQKNAIANKLEQSVNQQIEIEKADLINKGQQMADIIEHNIFKVGTPYQKYINEEEHQTQVPIKVKTKPGCISEFHEIKDETNHQVTDGYSKSICTKKLRPVVTLSGKLSYVEEGEKVGYRKYNTHRGLDDSKNSVTRSESISESMTTRIKNATNDVIAVKSKTNESVKIDDLSSRQTIKSKDSKQIINSYQSMSAAKDSTSKAKRWGIDMSKYT